MGWLERCFAELPDPRSGNATRHDLLEVERWLGKFGQRDRWIFCLTAAMLPRIRRAHDEANPPDA